jgi:hypothetical protein
MDLIAWRWHLGSAQDLGGIRFTCCRPPIRLADDDLGRVQEAVVHRIATPYFFDDPTLLARRHGHHPHGLVPGRVKRLALHLEGAHPDLRQDVFELPEDQADTLGERHAAGLRILARHMQHSLEVIKPWQQLAHEVGGGILLDLLELLPLR